MRLLISVGLTWLALLTAVPALADAELVLQDGKVLKGREVKRVGNLYNLTLESGDVATFPIEFVREVRLSAKQRDPDFYGLQRAEPATLAGESARPKGVLVEQPRVLAGTNVKPITPAEATAALGPPAKWQKGVINPEWRPTSDWDNNPETTNNFAPSTWAKGTIDPNWEPTSGFPDKPLLPENPSRWQQAPINPQWEPEDAFKKKDDSSKNKSQRLVPADGFHLAGITGRRAPDEASLAEAEIYS